MLWLRQKFTLLAIYDYGIDIPAKFCEDSEPGMRRVLNMQGEAWAARELRRERRAEIEFWAKIVLPILSLILSIYAVLKRH